jgi:hypothetical protein
MCHVDIAVVIHPELLCEHSQAVKTYWNEKFGLAILFYLPLRILGKRKFCC